MRKDLNSEDNPTRLDSRLSRGDGTHRPSRGRAAVAASPRTHIARQKKVLGDTPCWTGRWSQDNQ